jgi:hAT family C-terminal dimerisation region
MKLGYTIVEADRLEEQLLTYRIADPPFTVSTDVEHFNLARWWRERSGQRSDELVKIGRLLADIVPHAASPERLFSMMGWLHSNRRNRLNVDTVKALATIKLEAQGR